VIEQYALTGDTVAGDSGGRIKLAGRSAGAVAGGTVTTGVGAVVVVALTAVVVVALLLDLAAVAEPFEVVFPRTNAKIATRRKAMTSPPMVRVFLLIEKVN
jgi:predicted metalloprotease